MRKQFLALACALAALVHTTGHAQNAWVIGQSAPLTGSNAAFGEAIRDGAAAYFKMVNASGGVNGAPIELITMDDQNKRAVAGENATKLLGHKGIVALFGFASSTLSLDAMPQAEKARVLFFAPFSGANPVRVTTPTLFTLRASYGDELDKILAFWTGLGLKRVVVVHYDDTVGQQNLAVVTQYLAKQNNKPLAFSLKRNAKIDDAKFKELEALKPEVIINTVLSGPAAQISKELVEYGMFIPMSSLSFIGAQQYIDAAGAAGAGVSITQVVPSPTSNLPVVRECATALKNAGITQRMNSAHLESCIGAKVLVEALRRARKVGDAHAVLQAMTNLGSYDTGGFTVNYSPTQHHGSKYVELGMVTRDGKLRY